MNNVEQINLAYEAQMEEFKYIREEIISNIKASRQSLSMALTAIGILIAGSPFIVNTNIPSLFLIAPLLFYIIAWVQVRYIFFQNNLGDYLEKDLTPNIRNSISNINPRAKFDVSHILEYQSLWRMRYQNILILPATAAYYGVPIFAASLSFIAYFIFKSRIQVNISVIEYLLIGINILFFIYSVILGLWTYRRLRPNKK
jgi:hypothetical protein